MLFLDQAGTGAAVCFVPLSSLAFGGGSRQRLPTTRHPFPLFFSGQVHRYRRLFGAICDSWCSFLHPILSFRPPPPPFRSFPRRAPSAVRAVPLKEHQTEHQMSTKGASGAAGVQLGACRRSKKVCVAACDRHRAPPCLPPDGPEGGRASFQNPSRPPPEGVGWLAANPGLQGFARAALAGSRAGQVMAPAE